MRAPAAPPRSRDPSKGAHRAQSSGGPGGRAPQQPGDPSSRAGLSSSVCGAGGGRRVHRASAPSYTLKKYRLGLFSARLPRSYVQLGPAAPAGEEGPAAPSPVPAGSPGTGPRRPLDAPERPRMGSGPLGAECEGASRSQAPARSAAAHTGVQPGLQGHLDAEKQPRRRRAWGVEGWAPAARGRKGERTHCPHPGGLEGSGALLPGLGNRFPRAHRAPTSPGCAPGTGPVRKDGAQGQWHLRGAEASGTVWDCAALCTKQKPNSQKSQEGKNDFLRIIFSFHF